MIPFYSLGAFTLSAPLNGLYSKRSFTTVQKQYKAITNVSFVFIELYSCVFCNFMCEICVKITKLKCLYQSELHSMGLFLTRLDFVLLDNWLGFTISDQLIAFFKRCMIRRRLSLPVSIDACFSCCLSHMRPLLSAFGGLLKTGYIYRS